MITPQKRLCDWKEPILIVKKLTELWGEAGLIWLDGDGSRLGRWITLAVDPLQQICCRGLPQSPKASNPFEALRNLGPGHWTGWLSYEAAAWIEPQGFWKPDQMATLWIARHDPLIRLDLDKHQLWIEGYDLKRLEDMVNCIKAIHSKGEETNTERRRLFTKELSVPIKDWEWKTKQADYAIGVQNIKEFIANGDIFQANLSSCCTTYIPKDILNLEIFQKLRKKCPAPFPGLVVAGGDAKGEAIISASPERFITALANGQVETRPIKGTRPRNLNPLIDADLAADLICSPKDRAENIMIVDLLRNDIGKVCKPGSIHVPQLVGLESYPQVHHLTSVVKGELREKQSWVDLLEACWPGGSITGAPKLRACQRLSELEPTSRGPYCGCLLRVNWHGELDSSIIIRSLIRQADTLRAHAGCGIVAESESQAEAEELSWKLLPIMKALQ